MIDFKVFLHDSITYGIRNKVILKPAVNKNYNTSNRKIFFIKLVTKFKKLQ